MHTIHWPFFLYLPLFSLFEENGTEGREKKTYLRRQATEVEFVLNVVFLYLAEEFVSLYAAKPRNPRPDLERRD
jgi:hypothetical protein